DITINIIENEVIIEKIKVTLPEHVEGFLKCSNPRCISTSERNIINRFTLVDRATHLYKCDYCDHLYNVEE
ncbi:MAG TPA: aspartate carbamoyltransferase regulatory subunit, partial [Clostridia bacterium]|nr:aspartate carbamoyltransferase regulatory subunit [Clostridia bacterium]